MLEATPPMSDRILAGQWLLRRLRLGSQWSRRRGHRPLRPLHEAPKVIVEPYGQRSVRGCYSSETAKRLSIGAYATVRFHPGAAYRRFERRVTRVRYDRCWLLRQCGHAR
jgi:hypothetical protein